MKTTAEFENKHGSAWRAGWRILSAVFLGAFLLAPMSRAGELPGDRWDLLAIVYPPDRGVTIALGGTGKSLAAAGTCYVKAKRESAALRIEIRKLPALAVAGWTGRQYVLWAIDKEKRAVNLGLVPLRGKDTKWSAQVPFRAFGLMVTAEQDPKAATPSNAVALESLLPTEPELVVPVYRVEVALTPTSK